MPVAGDAALRRVPTCALTDRVEQVRQRVQAAGWDACVVANEARVVLGLLDAETLAGESAAMAEQVMDPAPITFRPDVPLEELVEYLRHHHVERAWVTTADGVLVGALPRDEAERCLHASAVEDRRRPGKQRR